MKTIKSNLTFGDALDLIKSGGYMRQDCWKEEDTVSVNDIANTSPMLVYKNNNSVIAWTPTQKEMFATDWQVHQ